MEPKIKRLFIEIDKDNPDKITTIIRSVYFRSGLSKTDIDESQVFDKIISDAGGQTTETFQAVMEHDEIYTSTALIPSYTNVSSADLFNILMFQANKHGVKGKRLYILREFYRVQWSNLRYKLAKECFTNNQLFVEADGDGWEEVSLEKLLDAIGE
ncbi:MAG: hypothetical protein BWY47_01923 [Bacteroidetes bacterium ADurb.Bin302]|nr:MAG: hypothetical protein BWY47_01923 [Bacteroidetes bacterium ADurb.Bin302]